MTQTQPSAVHDESARPGTSPSESRAEAVAGAATSAHDTFRTGTRTFTWVRPGQGDPHTLRSLDGLGQLQAMVEGVLPPPPIMATLGFTDLRPELGRVVVEMPAAELWRLVEAGALMDLKTLALAQALKLGRAELFEEPAPRP